MGIVAASSVSSPPLRGADLIYKNTALPASALGNWLQPDGTYGGQSTAQVFDVRMYNLIVATFVYAALTGGSTPTGGLLLCEVDFNDASPQVIQQITPTGLIAAGGGGENIFFGDCNAVAISGASFNSASTRILVPGHPTYLYLGVVTTGSPTGITSGRITLSGLYW